MRAILATLIVLILGIGGYVYWWNTVADLAVLQAERWKNDRIAEGYTITNSPIEVSGFPYRVKLSVTGMTLKAPDHEQQNEITVNDFWALAQPWQINHVIYGVNGSVEASWQEADKKRSVNLNATSAQGSATFDQRGKIKTLAIDINGLVIKDSWRTSAVLADRLQVHSRPAEAPTSTKENKKSQLPTQQYSIRLDNLFLGETVEFPLGNRIERLALSALMEGDLKDFQNKAAVTKWRDNGGILDVQEMNVIWGTSGFTANGTLALDKKYRPIGAFTAKITGFNQILNALAQTKKLDQKAVQTAGFVLNLLAKENKKGERYLDVPLSLQEGKLSLGPLFLMTLDPLFD